MWGYNREKGLLGTSITLVKVSERQVLSMNFEKYYFLFAIHNWEKKVAAKKDTRSISSKSSKQVLSGKNPDEVPICERYTLSIPEAAQYFGIGQVRLRSIIHANPNADFLLMVGNRLQIKRKKFEAFIDDMSVV